MPTFNATRAFVKAALTGQYDLQGGPMWKHAFRVADIAERLTDDADAIHVALLHDVVEDTDVTMGDLKDLGYTPRQLDAVKLLTHDIQKDTYEGYVRRIAASGNKLAIIVKLADNFDNSRPDRHVNLDPKKSAEFLARYKRAREILAGTEETEL